MTRTQLLENVKDLPRSEQINLALEIWEEIDPDKVEWPLTEAQKGELDRRLAADEADPQPAEAWPVVRERLIRGEW